MLPVCCAESMLAFLCLLNLLELPEVWKEAKQPGQESLGWGGNQSSITFVMSRGAQRHTYSVACKEQLMFLSSSSFWRVCRPSRDRNLLENIERSEKVDEWEVAACTWNARSKQWVGIEPRALTSLDRLRQNFLSDLWPPSSGKRLCPRGRHCWPEDQEIIMKGDVAAEDAVRPAQIHPPSMGSTGEKQPASPALTSALSSLTAAAVARKEKHPECSHNLKIWTPARSLSSTLRFHSRKFEVKRCTFDLTAFIW